MKVLNWPVLLVIYPIHLQAGEGDASLWQNGSFHLLILFVLVVFCLLLVKWRTRQLDIKAQKLQQEVEKKTAELMTLAEVIKELNATLDIQSIADRLQQHLAASLDAHVFALAIIDEEGETLEFRNVIENNLPLPPFSIALTNEGHVAIACIRQNRPVLMDRSEDSLKYLEKPSKPMAGENMHSVMYHPLTSHNGKVIGCITVQAPQPNAYSDSDKELMSTLASSTAIALDNAQAYAALEKVSLTDFLTSLPNRRAFFEAAKAMVGHSKRHLSTFALMLADIDHFKSFNDNHGHDAGDYILQQLAKVMKQAIREQDHLCRWGGEEFIFLLPETDLQGAVTLAEKLQKAIIEHNFSYQDQQFPITMTFGVTLCSPDEALTQCINRADKLLYQGKQSGRNQVVK